MKTQWLLAIVRSCTTLDQWYHAKWWIYNLKLGPVYYPVAREIQVKFEELYYKKLMSS